MDRRMNERVVEGGMDEWTDRLMDVWISGQIRWLFATIGGQKRWMNVWIGEQTRWMDVWTGGQQVEGRLSKREIGRTDRRMNK